jgi:hypothetical protein
MEDYFLFASTYVSLGIDHRCIWLKVLGSLLSRASNYELHDSHDPNRISRETIVCFGKSNEVDIQTAFQNPALRLAACSFQNCMF